jgi:hypothetical protein
VYVEELVFPERDVIDDRHLVNEATTLTDSLRSSYSFSHRLSGFDAMRATNGVEDGRRRFRDSYVRQ